MSEHDTSEPRFKVGDKVLAQSKREDFLTTVMEVCRHDVDGYIYYMVELPPAMRKGTPYMERWPYREWMLEPAPPTPPVRPQRR